MLPIVWDTNKIVCVYQDYFEPDDTVLYFNIYDLAVEEFFQYNVKSFTHYIDIKYMLAYTYESKIQLIYIYRIDNSYGNTELTNQIYI